MTKRILLLTLTITLGTVVTLHTTLHTSTVDSSPALQGTSSPIATAEALNPNANVRSEPSTASGDATIIGQIQPGEPVGVYGRYFEWLLIDFPASPNGRAWIFNGVVQLSTTMDALPVIDPASIPSVDSLQTATAAFEATASRPASTFQPTSPPPTPTQVLATFTPVAQTPTPVLITEIEAQPTLAATDAERERRLDALERLYRQPVTLLYGNALILLAPQTVGFTFDRVATAPAIDPGQPFSVATTPVTATFDSGALRTFIEQLAARYDRPREMVYDPNQLTFTPGAAGTVLDVESAVTRVESALLSPFAVSRLVVLPLNPTLEPDTVALRNAIIDYFNRRGVIYNGSNSVASVYVRNLETGTTMGLQENVLHSATSTAKIGVIANYFRYVFQTPSQEMIYRMIAAVVCSSNADANLLMNITGNGDDLAGIRNVTETYCQAGASHTRLDRHFGIGPAGEGGVPANYYQPAGAPACAAQTPTNTSVTATVDPDIQTTAADMGHFLEEIYTCAQNGTGLASTFPGAINQTECNAMLELFSGTNFAHLMELGVPDEVEISHKVGYAGQAVGDAGIVFSPGATYVLTMYMWDTRLGNFDSYALSRWAILGEVSRIVYNFFNPDAPLLQPQTPLNPNGGAACVLPESPQTASILDVDAGRFDENGIPLPSACYDWPICRPFDNWGN